MDDEPITASDFFQRGIDHLQRAEYERALECINQAIARNYFGGDVALVKGEILFELARFDEAMEWFGRAADHDPSVAPEATLWKGRVYLEKQQFGRALSAFNRVISSNPMAGEAWLCKGMVLSERGDYLAALGALDEARGLIGDETEKLADILFWQGRTLRGLNRNDEAAAALERVIASAPDFVDSYIELGDLHRSQGRLEQACEVYRRGLEAHPGDAALSNDYGNALRDLGKLDESLELLNSAVAQDTSKAVAIYNRALTFERLGRWNEALADYQVVVESNPRDADARLRRLDIFSRRDRFDEAYAEFAGLHEEDRDLPETQEVYARLLNRHARTLEAGSQQREALRVYRKLLELHPDFLDLDNPGKQFGSPGDRHATVLTQLDAIPADDPDADLIPLLRAFLLMRLDRREQSVSEAARALKGPYPEVAELMLADIAFHDVRDPEAALAALERALVLRKDYVAAMWLRVHVLEDGLGDVAGAIREYRRILEFSPGNPSVLHALAELYLDHGQAWRALRQFRELLAAAPGNVAVQRELARCYLALGRVSEAVDELKRLCAQDESDLEARLDLADALLRSGERDDAAELLDVVTRINSRLDPSIDDGVAEMRACLLNQQKRHEQALEALKNIPPGDLSDFGMLQKGLALAGAGQVPPAAECFTMLASECPPAHPEGRRARVELAKLERANGRHAQARALIEEALAGAPHAWKTRALLAWILREQGEAEAAEEHERLISFWREMDAGLRFMSTEEFEDAADEFKRVVVLSPDEPAVHYWLAAAWCMTGAYEQAGASLRRAAELDPSMLERAKEDAFFEEFAFSELGESTRTISGETREPPSDGFPSSTDNN